MAMMGQYPEPDGTATLTVAALWGKKQEVVGGIWLCQKMSI